MTFIFGILGAALAVYSLFALAMTKRYANILRRVPKEEFSLKALMPIGLLTQQILAGMGLYKPGTVRNVNASRKLMRLYGESRFVYLATAYVADIISYCVLILTGGCLLMAATGQMIVIAAMIGMTIAMPYMLASRLDGHIQKRQVALKMEFPDFLSKFILLLGAGMTVPEAWNTACRSADMSTPLYRELEETNREVNELGKSLGDALLAFSMRCRDTDISRFVATVVQDIEYGGADLAIMLSDQSAQSWRSRKQEALRLGQEASSKLSFTMMLMFGAILLLVIAPAMMSMQGL